MTEKERGLYSVIIMNTQYFIEAYQWHPSLILANLEWKKKNNRQDYSIPQDTINLTHVQSSSVLTPHSQRMEDLGSMCLVVRILRRPLQSRYPYLSGQEGTKAQGSTNTGPGYEVWDWAGTADAWIRHTRVPNQDGDTSASQWLEWETLEAGENFSLAAVSRVQLQVFLSSRELLSGLLVMSSYILPWAQVSLFTCQGSRSFRVYSTRKGGAAGHDAECLPPQETGHGWQSKEPRECSKKGSPKLSSSFTSEQICCFQPIWIEPLKIQRTEKGCSIRNRREGIQANCSLVLKICTIFQGHIFFLSLCKQN